MVLDAEVEESVKRKLLAGNALSLFGRPADANRLESTP
jgi:hypothetical protein